MSKVFARHSQFSRPETDSCKIVVDITFDLRMRWIASSESRCHGYGLKSATALSNFVQRVISSSSMLDTHRIASSCTRITNNMSRIPDIVDIKNVNNMRCSAPCTENPSTSPLFTICAHNLSILHAKKNT